MGGGEISYAVSDIAAVQDLAIGKSTGKFLIVPVGRVMVASSITIPISAVAGAIFCTVTRMFQTLTQKGFSRQAIQVRVLPEEALRGAGAATLCALRQGIRTQLDGTKLIQG